MTLQLGGDGAITGCTSLENPDLTVSGLTISGSFDAEKVLVASGTAAAPSYTFSGDTDNGLYYAGTNSIGLATAGTNAIIVDSAQNVGIGTTTPGHNLDLIGTTTSAFRIRSSASATRGFEIWNNSSTNEAYISNYYGGPIIFQTTNTERLRIDSSGRLLVGTSSASKTLRQVIQGNSADSTGNAVLALAIGRTNPGTGLLGQLQFTNSSHNVGARITAEGATNWVDGSSHPASLVFSTTADGASSPTERMRITNAGNIEFNTTYTDPQDATLSLRPGFLASDTGGVGLGCKNHSGSANDGLAIYGHDGVSIQTAGNNERMRIDSSGNVGIGTTSPNSKLTLSTGDKIFVPTGEALNFGHTDGSTNTERMRIDSAGRLLVGVSSAVAGTQDHKGLFSSSASSTHETFGLQYPGIATWGFSVLNNADLRISRDGNEYLKIDSSGKVGIGTTSPTRNLTVSNGTNPIVAVQNSGQSTEGVFNAPSGGTINLGTVGTTDLTLSTNSLEKVRIDSSGRLLVGTSSARTFASFGGSTRVSVEGTGYANSSQSLTNNEATIDGGYLVFAKTRGTSLGSFTSVNNGDRLGSIWFQGADGTALVHGAEFGAEVDGTPGTSDMPTRLVFSTTADGASSPTERMRIDSTGNLYVGSTEGYLVTEYSDVMNDGENLTITFAGASNVHRGQNIFQITYCNHTNNSANVYAASFIINIRDSATSGYSLSITDFQSIYNVGSTVGVVGDLTFVDNNDGTATLALPNKVGAGGNSGNTTARVTIQRLCSGYGLAMYPTQAVAV
jgi:hypothetical protein